MVLRRLSVLSVIASLALMSCASSLSKPQDTEKFVGTVVPPHHQSLVELDAMSFSQERGFPVAVYLVKEKSSGNYLVLVGERVLGQGEQAHYTIKQAIPLKPLAPNQRLMAGVLDQCSVGGVYDEALVLLGTESPAEKPYVTEFRRGWRVNYSTKSLDEIETIDSTYRCENVAHTL